MNMKWFALLGLILFLGVAVAPSINAFKDQSKPVFNGLVQSILSLEYDASDIPDLIPPESENVIIHINISYQIEGFFSRLLSILFKYQMIPIEVTLGDVPKWCTAKLIPNNLWSPIRTDPDINHAILRVWLDPKSPAFKPFNITIRTKASKFTGPLGFTYISEAEDIISVELTPGYYSNFQFDYHSYIVTPPLEPTVAEINLTSFANADVLVRTQIIDPPENWTITIPTDIFVEAWGKETIILTIIPPDIQNEIEHFHVLLNISTWEHPELGYDMYLLIFAAHVP